jgi:PKHD-type hydroxylase
MANIQIGNGIKEKDLDMQDKKKGINIENTSWAFALDPVHLYAFWDKAFTEEECNSIVKIAQNKGLMKGATTGDDPTKSRNSHISWLNPSDNLQWFYERLTGIAVQLNDEYFKFDLYGINEGLQFTNYKAPSGKYGKHIDRGIDTAVRKLSISVQLTNPDEYEGGELCLYDGDTTFPMDKTQGTLMIFPSYVLHEVKPVTKGERNSLVTWVTGPAFK